MYICMCGIVIACICVCARWLDGGEVASMEYGTAIWKMLLKVKIRVHTIYTYAYKAEGNY